VIFSEFQSTRWPHSSSADSARVRAEIRRWSPLVPKLRTHTRRLAPRASAKFGCQLRPSSNFPHLLLQNLHSVHRTSCIRRRNRFELQYTVQEENQKGPARVRDVATTAPTNFWVINTQLATGFPTSPSTSGSTTNWAHNLLLHRILPALVKRAGHGLR
jgi:hypothetical protein